MKALTFLMSVLVGFVPALAPFAPGGDEPAMRSDGPGADDPSFARLDALLDAAGPRDDADEGAGNETEPEAEPVDDGEPDDPGNASFVKPKRAPEPVVFSAAWDEKDPDVSPGGAVPLRLNVTNHHLYDIQIAVAAGDVTPGWTVTMHTQYMGLAPGESAEIPVTFEAPLDARPGSTGRFALVLVSQFPVETRAFTFTAKVPVPKVVHDVDAYASHATRYAAPGELVNYTVTVFNAGNVDESFVLSALGAAPGWSASFTERRLDLEPLESAQVTMSVRVPEDARHEDASFVNATVRSVHAPSAVATAPTFTSVNTDAAGLPVKLEPICMNRPVDVPYEAEAYAPERMCLDLARHVPETPLTNGETLYDVEEAAEAAADDATADVQE